MEREKIVALAESKLTHYRKEINGYRIFYRVLVFSISPLVIIPAIIHTYRLTVGSIVMVHCLLLGLYFIYKSYSSLRVRYTMLENELDLFQNKERGYEQENADAIFEKYLLKV